MPIKVVAAVHVRNAEMSHGRAQCPRRWGCGEKQKKKNDVGIDVVYVTVLNMIEKENRVGNARNQD